VAVEADATTSSLATYPFRNGNTSTDLLRPGKLQLSWSHMWFEAMVQMVVKQLNGTPFLLRARSQGQLRLSYVPLNPEELAKGWDHIQQRHLATSSADDAVILVHPVPSDQQPCAVQVVNQGQACNGCPHTQPGAETLQQQELLHGKFGDCCSEHSDTSTHQHKHSNGKSRDEGKDSVLAYYGLVVQTSNAADPLQGCYLLKTMQVKQQSGSAGGCHCTHYSLTRVCKGPSLQQQYQAAWLVPN
jgi:hypothetical protein